MRRKHNLLAAAGLVLALGACAGSPPAKVADAPRVDRDCLSETGTRVEMPEGECVNARGRVVTREDLEHSGGQTVGDALRRVVR